MIGDVGEFEALCRKVTHRFLRSAILIDDEIVTPLEHDDFADVVSPPFVVDDTSVPAGQAAQSDRLRAVVETAPARSDVAIKPLADAFLDQRIICAVLKPVPGDDRDRVVTRAVTAASSADVVIIDWYLKVGDPELTLRSLVNLLTTDAADGGRKRLILVYTSAVPLTDRCVELRGRLEQAGLPVAAVGAELPTLRCGSSRIVFVEKASSGRGTTVDQLPELALAEFTKEAIGLMPIFALGAIASIRDSTHHLLSIFTPDLDPALLAHRMVLEEPADARDFALETFMLQLKSVLTGCGGLDGVLDKAAIGAWFNSRFPAAGSAALEAKGVVRSDFKSAVEDADPKDKYGKEKVRLFHSALFLSEPPDDAAERERSCELARMSTHLREAEGSSPLPEGWRPHLTLGSIVRAMGEGGGSRYYLCTQPLCDTLRLEGPTFFSFVGLETGGKGPGEDYWVIVRSEGAHLQLKANRKGGGRFFAEFQPDAGRRKVLAAETGRHPRSFRFTDRTNRTYDWLADVDRLKAQRAAEEMASALGRVGIDELEWLRMGGRIY